MKTKEKKSTIKSKHIKLLIICSFVTAVFAAGSCFVVSNTLQNLANNKKEKTALLSDINDGEIKNIQINIAPEVKDVVIVETGSTLPDINSYFSNDYKAKEEDEISYYSNENEVKLEEFTTSKDNVLYTKGTRDIDVLIVIDEELYQTKLVIQDTTAPSVTLKDITITQGSNVDAKNFVDSYNDNSGSTDYTVKINNTDSYSSVGVHEMSLTICDNNKNCYNGTAKLTVKAKSTSKPTTPSKPSNPGGSGSGGSGSGSGGSGSGSGSGGSGSGGGGSSTQTPAYGAVTNPNVRYVTKSEAVQAYGSYETSRNNVLEKTNQYRSEVGASPLTLDYDLSIISTIRAMEMAYNDVFSHTRPDGTKWFAVYYQYFNINRNSVVIGENLAKGYRTDADACQGWRDSEGHYKNMINTSYKKMGVGKFVYKGTIYWVQTFSG